ncbi:MAG: hypothetical protein AB1679_12160 [Actinomycetota bacterium]
MATRTPSTRTSARYTRSGASVLLNFEPTTRSAVESNTVVAAPAVLPPASVQVSPSVLVKNSTRLVASVNCTRSQTVSASAAVKVSLMTWVLAEPSVDHRKRMDFVLKAMNSQAIPPSSWFSSWIWPVAPAQSSTASWMRTSREVVGWSAAKSGVVTRLRSLEVRLRKVRRLIRPPR